MKVETRTSRKAFLLLAVVLLPALSSVLVAESASLEERVEIYLQPYLDIDHLSGTILVARGNEVLYERSFGFANLEHGVRNKQETRFGVGSVNKPMTIVILARLLDEKKLELTDKLAEFLPDFPRAEEITVDRLLNHSAGIPHRVTESFDETQPQTPASMVALASRKDLVFEPGSDSVYSSAGFSVLSRVLELASGKSYGELLESYVLGPASMAHTSDAGTRSILENRASSYYFDSYGLVNAPPKGISYLVGAGSVYSTPRDLLALQRALLAGELGVRAQQLLVGENGNISWNGLAHGYRAFIDHDSESDVTVSVASNLTSGALDKIRSALPKIVAGEEVPTPAPINAVPADVALEVLESYRGAYQLRPGRNLELRVAEGRVLMEEWLLIPTSERTFFSPQDYAEIEVVLDESHEVVRLDWTTGGQTYPLPKVSAVPSETAPAARVIDSFISQFVDLAMFDGSVLVDVGGEIRYERSFGLASYEHSVTHDAETKFRVASVSKTLTDAAFAVLIQRGSLTLGTTLATYLPKFPSAESITIGQLLNHTSGIAHTNAQPWGDGTTTFSLDELIERLAVLPLDFEPGTDTSYSNGGYAVAAKVLELEAGGSFDEVMRELLFGPLGMSETGHIEDVRTPIAGMATGYEPGARPGERRQSRFYAVETRPGGGSFYSTPRDLLRFGRAVFREGFLEESLVANVLGAEDGSLLSQGRSPGFVAKFFYEPDRDVLVISLANNYAVPADWARTIAGLATGEVLAAPWPEVEQATTRITAGDPRLGRYRNSRGGGELSVERNEHGELVLREADSASVTGLVPLADDAFLMPSYFQRCEQETASRVITCGILSGDPRYTNQWAPIPETR